MITYLNLREVTDQTKIIHYSNMLSYLMDCSGTNFENRLIEKGFDIYNDPEMMQNARLLVEEFFNNKNQYIILALDENDIAIGFIQFTYNKERECCMVNHLYVAKKHRRANNSIGISLVNQAIKLITFSKIKATTLTFEKVTDSEIAKNFFDKIEAKLMYSTYGIVL